MAVPLPLSACRLLQDGFQGVLGHEFVGVVAAVGMPPGGPAERDERWVGRRVVGEINVAGRPGPFYGLGEQAAAAGGTSSGGGGSSGGADVPAAMVSRGDAPTQPGVATGTAGPAVCCLRHVAVCPPCYLLPEQLLRGLFAKVDDGPATVAPLI